MSSELRLMYNLMFKVPQVRAVQLGKQASSNHSRIATDAAVCFTACMQQVADFGAVSLNAGLVLKTGCPGARSRHYSDLTMTVRDGIVPSQARRGGCKGAARNLFNGAAAPVKSIMHQQRGAEGRFHPGVGHLSRG